MSITIDLPTLRTSLQQKSINMDFWNNATLGVIPYGAGVVTDFAATLGIPLTVDFDATLGIPTPTTAAPTSVLAANIGQGAIMLQWSHPNPDEVNYYEVYGSATDGGVFTKLQNGQFFVTHGIIYNIPISITVYLKVRAVGLNGVASNFSQAKRGKLQTPTVRCSVRAIGGSTIPAGAIFPIVLPETGRMIGLRASSNINITC